eukprot:TRINITY_DN110897_c0_g1_i1.p1 TRINITY_DN110897_c0_g1~~TRINITY_DN110897_c0_g1_i1.p1  ORF type:complete len:102 (+),score=10.31 TRINITY_DN110897_c0_g1_i1:173-478(+)
MISVVSATVLLLHICILTPAALELYEVQDGPRKVHRLHTGEPREYYDYWQDCKLLGSFVTGVGSMIFLEWIFGRRGRASTPAPEDTYGLKVQHYELFQCAI